MLELSASFELFSLLIDLVDEASRRESQGHHKGHKHSGRKSRMGGYNFSHIYVQK